MKVLPRLILAMSFILFIAGCKKDDPATPQNKCKITSIVSGGTSIAITYNTNGTISSVTNISATTGTAVTSYSYSGNTITESVSASGQLLGKVIVTVNGAGLATNVKSESSNGTDWNNDAYEYNGNQASKSTSTNSGGELLTYLLINGQTTTWFLSLMTAMSLVSPTILIRHLSPVTTFPYCSC